MMDAVNNAGSARALLGAALVLWLVVAALMRVLPEGVFQ
jgi:hypothetical protein